MLFRNLIFYHLSRDSKAWSTGGIEGVHRFLARIWRLVVGAPLPDASYRKGTVVTDDKPTLEQLRALHKCIDKVRLLLDFAFQKIR